VSEISRSLIYRVSVQRVNGKDKETRLVLVVGVVVRFSQSVENLRVAITDLRLLVRRIHVYLERFVATPETRKDNEMVRLAKSEAFVGYLVRLKHVSMRQWAVPGVDLLASWYEGRPRSSASATLLVLDVFHLMNRLLDSLCPARAKRSATAKQRSSKKYRFLAFIVHHWTREPSSQRVPGLDSFFSCWIFVGGGPWLLPLKAPLSITRPTYFA
jgi:hypothetical protein